MGSNKSAEMTRKYVMEDTGLTTGQIIEICSEIEANLGSDVYGQQQQVVGHQQVVRPNLAYKSAND